jgi:hypothetical protein
VRGCEVVTEPVLDEVVQTGGDEVGEARRLLLGEPAGLHRVGNVGVPDSCASAVPPMAATAATAAPIT